MKEFTGLKSNGWDRVLTHLHRTYKRNRETPISNQSISSPSVYRISFKVVGSFLRNERSIST